MLLVELVRRSPRLAPFLEETKQRQWRFISSFFGYMEAFGVERLNRWFELRLAEGLDADFLIRTREQSSLSARELTAISNRIGSALEEYRVELLQLGDDGWTQALELSQMTNVRATDCVHLATALIAGCDLLISRDEAFAKHARNLIPVAKPEELVQAAQRP